MLLPNLYQYADYREFLKDCYANNRARDARFSYRYLSQKAGVASSAFYKNVIDGRRNLSKGTIVKTCLALGLKEADAEYFENLVFFNQVRSAREKNFYFDKLTKLRGVYETRRVEEAQHAFYSEWHHTVVRELLVFAKHHGDWQALARLLAPAITAEQVRGSVELLERLGFVRKNAQGKWRQVDPVITTGTKNPSPAVIAFQLKMLEMAKEAYARWNSPDRLMSSVTFSISKDAFELSKKKIRQLRAELLELSRLEEAPHRVYHLGLNLFPVSEPISP
jgi:uncharacterized protein (TIGR02147 family)